MVTGFVADLRRKVEEEKEASDERRHPWPNFGEGGT